MSLKKFADADLYTNKSGRQRRGRRKGFTDRRIFGYQRQNNRCPAGYPCRAQSSLTGFKEGDHIIKYGAPIGHAREVITTGSWVNEKISRPTWKGYGNMNSIRNLFRNSHPESHFLLMDIAAKMEKWESGTRYG